MEEEIQLSYQRKKDNIDNLKAFQDKHNKEVQQLSTKKKKKKSSSRTKCSSNANGEENNGFREKMVRCTVTPNLNTTKIESLGNNVKLSTVIQGHDTVRNNPTVLLDSIVQNPLEWTPFANGFIGAAFKAYSNHHHLSFTPDDVWIAIATAFLDM